MDHPPTATRPMGVKGRKFRTLSLHGKRSSWRFVFLLSVIVLFFKLLLLLLLFGVSSKHLAMIALPHKGTVPVEDLCSLLDVSH
jgi:hypothetical protein